MTRDRNKEPSDLKTLISDVLAAEKNGQPFGVSTPPPLTAECEEKLAARKENEFLASRRARTSKPKLDDLLKRLQAEGAPLQIDRVISKRICARRTKMNTDFEPFFSEDLFRMIGRRMIEIAYRDCEAEKKQNRIADVEDLEALRDKAHDALKNLKDLLLHLNFEARSGQDLVLPLLSSEGGFRNSGHRNAEDAVQGLRGVVADASILWAARGALKRLENAAGLRSRRIRAGGKDETKKHHVAFARPVADVWTYLTRSLPSSGTSGTPFLEFLEASWCDAYGTQTAPRFVGAVRKLHESGKLEVSRTAPPWLCVETLLLVP